MLERLQHRQRMFAVLIVTGELKFGNTVTENKTEGSKQKGVTDENHGGPFLTTTASHHGREEEQGQTAAATEGGKRGGAS